ncbi:MAG: hypothetical protein K6A90_08670 [Lachnospiraceae bacterium]|nr:hypothetical protein [Lachnospiraceae bacterium]
MNKLNDNELINATGGTFEQTKEDLRLLKAKGLVDKNYNEYDILSREGFKLMKDAWSKLGIVYEIGLPADDKNQYFLGANEIDRKIALEMLNRY